MGVETTSALSALRQISHIVTDSADIDQLRGLGAIDATTNPSLLLAAAQLEMYAHLLQDAIAYGRSKKLDGDELVEEVCDRLLINFGKEIVALLPGLISSEADARYSFDAKKSIEKGKKLIRMYQEVGVSKDRVLIKLASTYEGIQAAKALEKEGIRCNMTLCFTLCQAVAAAQAGCTLVSPFVGRILDWHKAKFPDQDFSGSKDPGVQSVLKIYSYFKKFNHKTTVMAASFRSVEQVLELSGCDKLTVSPKLLRELDGLPESKVARKMDGLKMEIEPIAVEDPATFLWMLNEDQMAWEKLGEGIRAFHADAQKLRAFVRTRL